jgi:hypothetical protein
VDLNVIVLCIKRLQSKETVQSIKLLLAFASTVVLGFWPRRDPSPYFCYFQTSTCFETGPPLSYLSLTHSLTHSNNSLEETMVDTDHFMQLVELAMVS